MSEAPETKVRPLFKKKDRTKSTSRVHARSRLEDEEGHVRDPKEANDDAEDEEVSTMDAIQTAKKKRKLLNSMLFRRGIDVTTTLQPSSQTKAVEEVTVARGGSKDLNERLHGTFSGGTGGDTASGDGVIQRKHKDAMEEFIRVNLKNQDTPTQQNQNHASHEPSNIKAMEAKLYAELASSAQTLAGITEKAPALAEGDVGAGGAMLGGTGIAEVTLPVEERIKAARATEQATVTTTRMHQVRVPVVLNQNGTPSASDALPMHFSVGMGKRGKKDPLITLPGIQPQDLSTHTESSSLIDPMDDIRTASSAGFQVLKSDVSGVGSSYSHNFRLHSHEWVQQKKEEEQKKEQDIARKSQQSDNDVAANQERLGFEAARRGNRGDTFDSSARRTHADNRESQPRSTDDRVWKSFMTRQREHRGR